MTEQLETKPAPAEAITAPASEAEKQHVERTGWRKLFPQSFLDNSTRISNAGLFFFTGSMLHSGYRGKQISKKLFDEQIGLLKKAGYEGERLIGKTADLVEKKVITRPGWHSMRLIYLLTACTSFAFGAAFKRKEETPEELERYSQMSLPEYMRVRTQEALDPVNHSRQTVGVVGAVSGLMAVKSALSQPGGVHKSELFVGSLLALGSAGLAYIKDAGTAQQFFTGCWLARAPAIITGTGESLNSLPGYKNPFVAEMKMNPEYLKGIETVLREGHPEKVWFGFKTVHRTGIDAVKVYDKAFAGLTLPDKRMDIAYPFGQWGNLYSALLGIAGKKPAAKKGDVPASNPVIVADDSAKPVATAMQHREAPVEAAAIANATPSTKVAHIEAGHERLEAKELAAQMSA